MVQARDPSTFPPEAQSDRVRPADLDGDHRGLTDLLRELRDDTMTLLSKEIELAKVETQEKLSCVARNAGYLAAGGLVAYAGFLCLLWAAGAGVALLLVWAGMSAVTASWLSPLLIGAAVVATGAVLVAKAINTLKNTTPTPQRTVESLKEDKQWFTAKLH